MLASSKNGRFGCVLLSTSFSDFGNRPQKVAGALGSMILNVQSFVQQENDNNYDGSNF